jgi:hypothetical protein
LNTNTTPPPPSLAADRQAGSERKGVRHRRRGVDQGTAHELHQTHRRRWYRLIQRRVLDIVFRAGSFHVADLDDLELPDGVGRTVVGTAIKDLAWSGLIRRAGPPTATTAGGRHHNYLHTWRPAVDRAAVEAWKLSHPVPPDPELEIRS